MKRSKALIIATAILVVGVVVAAAVVLTRSDDSTAGDGTSSHSPTNGPSASVATHTVTGAFSVYTNDWFETIPNTSWNNCNGGPECEGEECYGVGAAHGLGPDAEVLVNDAQGITVANGAIDTSWGWKHGTGEGACVMDWSVEVPASATGVLTVTFDDNPSWTESFTLAEMQKGTDKLEFIGIGKLNSCPSRSWWPSDAVAMCADGARSNP